MGLKEFIGIFFSCLIICWVFTFLFAAFFLENLYAMASFIAFLLAVFITIFVKQESRIEELENKMEIYLNNKEDTR